MSKNQTTIRIFISSPGDVAEERALTRKVIERLQGEFSGRVELEPIYWEHEPLRATASFPEEITRPSETDIVITILWSRLGTRLPAKFKKPDGSRYESGTEYEFEDAYLSFKERGSPDLLIYRKTADPKVSLKDKKTLLDKLKQKEALDSFFDRWFHDSDEGTLVAAFHPFDNSADFEEIFESHLSKLIKTRLPDSAVIDKVPASKSVWKEGSPFRGLSVFNFEHAPVFFGRTKAVSEILNALRIQAAAGKAFVMVLGMSGGGKSSLVRAGVLPMLTQPGVIEGVGLWRRAIMKPGDSPGDLFDGLAACLLQQSALPELSADGTDFKELAKILRETPKAAVPLIKGGLSQAASEIAKTEQLEKQPVAKLVLLIDQMEEMFSLGNITHDERRKFIETIDALSRSGRVWVIATLRSDFYPRTAELEGLVALKEGAGQYDLLSPTPAEIGQMIRQPAQAAGLYFEEDASTNERLDDVLRDAASKNPGALPLLEFTLEELYKQRTGNGMLTYEAYNNLGGVEGALAQRAEEVFAGLDPKVKQVMDIELHSLISIGVDDGERISRKYTPLEMVTATPETKIFVDAFVEARLFTTDLAADGSAVVSIAHEALLQHWPRLQEWIEKNREDLRIHARLNVASKRWEKENKSREFLLSAAKQVNEAEELIKNKKIELTQSEKAFVRASMAKRKRVWWIKRGIAAALVVLTIVASGAAYLAQQERDKAKTEAKTAEQVSEFLVGLFEVSDPSEALGDTITAREILDKGAEKIEKELADQPEVQATMMNTIGEVYMKLALFEEALPLLESSLSIRRELFGNIHPDISNSLNSLGRLHEETGEYSLAMDYYEEALKIRKVIYGDKHERVASILNNLATLYISTGEYKKAEDIVNEALEIWQEIYATDHKEIASAFNILGRIHEIYGNYTKALEFHNKALKMRRKLFGEFHPSVAHSINNLATVNDDLGDFDNAKELHFEALSIYQYIYGNEHPNTALSLNNLGYVFKKKGNYLKAEEYYKKSLNIRLKVFGEMHPSVATSLNNLATVYSDNGDYHMAEEVIMKALNIRRKVLGDDHPDLIFSLNSLALLYSEQGKYSEAERFYRESLLIARKFYGNNHRNVATILGNLGFMLREIGKKVEGNEMLIECLKIKRETLGNNHPSVAFAIIDVAKIYLEKGEPDKTEEMLLEALRIQQNSFGNEHIRVAITLNNLGYLNRKQGDLTEAEEFYRKSLSIKRTLYGDNHISVATTLSNLAYLYKEQGHIHKAKEYYNESTSILIEVYGNEHPDIAYNLRSLGDMYYEIDEYFEAEKKYIEALTILRKKLPVGHQKIALTQSKLGACLIKLNRLKEAEEHLLNSYSIIYDKWGESDEDVINATIHIIELYKAWDKPENVAEYEALLADTAAVSEPI